jgi:NAD(P)-dependent dehydrogenase (short-subunit alcohol dehydrogenase family)
MIQLINHQVVLITGANSGVGLESARALYVAGAKVYMACRSKDKAVVAMERIKAASDSNGRGKEGELVFLQLDLTDLHSVVAAAEDFLR